MQVLLEDEFVRFCPKGMSDGRTNMLSSCWRFILDTEGQDLIEYALLAGTLALGTLAAMRTVRSALQTEFSAVGNTLTGAS